MTDISTIVGVLILAYLLGSIPFGLLFSRMGGLGDIRETGSGNIGATNVLRSGNKLLAALTLLADAAKGSAAIFIALEFAGFPTAYWAGLAALLGHISLSGWALKWQGRCGFYWREHCFVAPARPVHAFRVVAGGADKPSFIAGGADCDT